jgi:hypothetical protein
MMTEQRYITTNLRLMSAFSVPDVVIKSPVPSDIEVSQSIAPAPIGEIAEASGVLPDECDLYGKTKAKVSSLSNIPS